MPITDVSYLTSVATALQPLDSITRVRVMPPTPVSTPSAAPSRSSACTVDPSRAMTLLTAASLLEPPTSVVTSPDADGASATHTTASAIEMLTAPTSSGSGIATNVSLSLSAALLRVGGMTTEEEGDARSTVPIRSSNEEDTNWRSCLDATTMCMAAARAELSRRNVMLAESRRFRVSTLQRILQ